MGAFQPAANQKESLCDGIEKTNCLRLAKLRAMSTVSGHGAMIGIIGGRSVANDC